MNAPNLIEVEGLAIEIGGPHGAIEPVSDVSLSISAGGALAVVGESGSGKTLTLRAIIGLLPRRARIARGVVRYGAGDAQPTACDPANLRGRGLAMVMQEPMTALNPTMRVVDQVMAGPLARGTVTPRQARARATELLGEVGIPAPAQRLDSWPHELSGGMRQRVMIAMALATDPRVLLCDEPTTALDVTVQDQIMRVLERLRAELGLAMIFVTHDLALAGQICDEVTVLYAGRSIEHGTIADVYDSPSHPYTRALLDAVPDSRNPDRPLTPIPGEPPDPATFPEGCRFAPRCPRARPDCATTEHVLLPVAPFRDDAHRHDTACIHPLVAFERA